MKISCSKLMQWSVIIAILYFYFYPHLVIAVGGKYCYPALFLCMGLSAVVLILKRKLMNDYFGLAWVIILIISTVTNRGLQRKAWLWPVTFAMLIIMLLAMTTGVKWHKAAIRLLLAGSFIYCIATFILFAAPGLYTGLVHFWGRYPNGTERGLYGYRAGIADNHSANGTYCVVSFLIAISLYFLEKSRKRKNIYLFITTVSLVAVLLTTKRAHLLFGCFAAIVCYYFSQKRGKMGRGFKILFIAIVALLLFYYAASFIPIISDFMQGFEGQDDISNGRYEFWMLALSYYKSNPIFGIGWLGFRYKTLGLFSKGSGYVDVHNVYIQILTESGIVGTLIMIFIFIGTLAKTIQMLDEKLYSIAFEERKALCISLCMQVFCLVYGFTGNFLYDRTCFIYIFACALCYSIKHSSAQTAKVKYEKELEI